MLMLLLFGFCPAKGWVGVVQVNVDQNITCLASVSGVSE